MGGDSFFPPIIEDQSLDAALDSCDDEGLSSELDIGPESELTFGQIQATHPPKSLLHQAAEKQKHKVYAQIWTSYQDLQLKIETLDQARIKVLSYTPGSWAENANDIDWDEHHVPKTTSLLLIGPKASGKSSLVNKISQVLEDGFFTSTRAQVSNSTLTEDGTYFSHQYMLPRGSGSICLCDTRGLSNDTCENLKMLKRWRKKGVRHGELVKRESDSEDLQYQLKCKAQGLQSSSHRIPISFVVFVVNGLSVLEAMDGDDVTKKEFYQQVPTVFNDPLLSFKDDKPAVVVTHGDLLSISDRVRIRYYLGELLRIPPVQQIFDIPESNDIATELTILDLLIYCLEHADRNLPALKERHADTNLHVKKQAVFKISESWWALFLVMLLSLVPALSFFSQLPTNETRSRGLQGCYHRSPNEESHQNSGQASYHRHAQSQEDSAQASHPHKPTNASEKVGVQGFPSCEPTVALPIVDSSTPDAPSCEKGAQENGLPISRPHVLSDKSHKDGIQASQTNSTKKGDHAQAIRPQAPSNVRKRESFEGVEALLQTKKSSKNIHHRTPADASVGINAKKFHTPMDKSENHGVSVHQKLPKKEDRVEWHRIRHLWSGDDDHKPHARAHDKDKVEWHKIRHLWSGDDDHQHQAQHKRDRIDVEWHKIRHLWSSLEDD